MNLLNSFDTFLKSQKTAQNNALREESYKDAMALGNPHRRLENWHYTSLKFLNDIQFMPSAFVGVDEVVEKLKLALAKPSLGAQRVADATNVFFVNGIFVNSISDALPADVTLGAYHPKKPAAWSSSLEAANYAMTAEFYEMKISPNANVEKPLALHFISASGKSPLIAVHPHLKLSVGSFAKLGVLEIHSSIEDKSHYTNSYLNLDLQDHAEVEFARIQNDHSEAWQTAQAQFNLAESSKLKHLSVALGCQLSRWEGVFHLNGPSIDVSSLGVSVGRNTQHLDNTTEIHHHIGDCHTEQLYKNILAEQSKAVFTGKIRIDKNAQKADSSQLNNNLLLSKTAEANSQPILQIFADDVKAAHGSTVGQLSEDELFYLLSRAIPKDQALKMLAEGFALEVVERLSSSVIRQEVLKQMRKKLNGIEVKF